MSIAHDLVHRADGALPFGRGRTGVQGGHAPARAEGGHVADVREEFGYGVGDPVHREASHAVPDQDHGSAEPRGAAYGVGDAPLEVVQRERGDRRGLRGESPRILRLIRLRYEPLSAVQRLVHRDDAVTAQRQLPADRAPERTGAVRAMDEDVRPPAPDSPSPGPAGIGGPSGLRAEADGERGTAGRRREPPQCVPPRGSGRVRNRARCAHAACGTRAALAVVVSHADEAMNALAPPPWPCPPAHRCTWQHRADVRAVPEALVPTMAIRQGIPDMNRMSGIP